MRILIADDHALFRDSLKSLLCARDHEVIGEAADGPSAVHLCLQLNPDVVLMDLRMPGGGGLTALRELAARGSEAKVIILTASDDEADLFEAVKAGAQGYLLKDLQADRFFELLEGVGRGEPAITPALARKLLDEFARPKSSTRTNPDALTDRESEVLERMVRGVTSNRELADDLGVSENTVKFHVRNILDKLRLHNRAQAVAYALRHHLVPPGGANGS